MTEKSQFDAEEWGLIASAPSIAAMYVIVSEKGGTLRETMAVGKAYAEAREESTGSALVDEIVSSVTAVPANEFGSKEEFQAQAVSRLGDAKRTLAAKADADEVAAYREFVLEVVQRVAAADKSGGFLGIGGERVSAHESAAIEEIRAALS
jgi:hypothetical protein